jgi:hypothetical protein
VTEQQPDWTIDWSSDDKRERQLTDQQAELLIDCENLISTLSKSAPLSESDARLLRQPILQLLDTGLTADWIEDNLPLRKGAVESIISRQP